MACALSGDVRRTHECARGGRVRLRVSARPLFGAHCARRVATGYAGRSNSRSVRGVDERSRTRDASRIRGFPGSDERRDRGHFLAHASGGGLDINLFHQNALLNRGWSPEGRRYRQMEQYAARHEGTLFFSRPIYEDHYRAAGADPSPLHDANSVMFLESRCGHSSRELPE